MDPACEDQDYQIQVSDHYSYTRPFFRSTVTPT